MLSLIIKIIPFAVGALIGAITTYIVTTRVLPNQKKQEKASFVLAELANAIRHFERSVQNLKSFHKGRRLGRIVDYNKCKYAEAGFVGLNFSDLMGLPSKLSRDVMQMGLVFKNQNIEVDHVISILERTSENDDERERKFEAVEQLIERMLMIVKMSKNLEENVKNYTLNTRALSANKEIFWSDEFYETGKKNTK